MIGCLTAPFRALGCLIVLAALAWGWYHRDRLAADARRLLGGASAAPAEPARAAVASPGRPGERAARTGRAKIASLEGGRADSVVLSASEVASLIGAGLDPRLRRQLDSLQIELREGEIVADARLATDRLPRDLIGPLAGALGASEPVQVAGPVSVARRGWGEWAVRRFRVRGIPLPNAVVSRLVSRMTGDSGRSGIPFRIPPAVRDIRLHPSGATLLGGRSP